MELLVILLAALLFFLYSLVSKRLSTTPVTAPMIFTVAGIGFSFAFPEQASGELTNSYVHLLAELTLIFVLFTDAASIDLKYLSRDHLLPTRMLLFGLPLTVVAGIGAAILIFFGTLTFWECALLAAILAPTDAALGQSVVTNETVPPRIRQAITVESGLNDGICLPLVVIFAGAAGMGAEPANATSMLGFSLMQVTLGPVAGIAVGFVGAKLIDLAVEKNYISATFEGISALCVAIAAFAAAESINGNGFIAAFVGGLVFGNTLKHKCKYLYEFAESEGQFFTLSTFLIFGVASFSLIGTNFEWTYLLYAGLSLTAIRMIPIGLSLIGTKTELLTKGFLGWFGPRGLASILFALLIIEKEDIAGGQKIISIVVVTVLLSVLFHGLSAAPLSESYGKFIKTKGSCMEAETPDES